MSVSVRIWGALAITLASMGGGAQASSLVFPGAPASTPSILALKAADGKASDVVSVVVLGEPDVTYEKVAAIPGKAEARHSFAQSPMIIRGGVVGGAFSTPMQAKAPAAATAPATPTPATATASAAPAPAAHGKAAAPAAAAPPPPAHQPASGAGKVK
ncbi:hypothetical protein LB524_02770 [Mesorhizobium sp. ESP6-5]|uniref:hypothetical protein n=1 Tax=Mesorhizobium sp. ESP6-5 TaxID=2876623 RepID=UPI001CCD253A|nr:hypothetical protein [Mesorhizobium sp. ESP6-5]MBZ9754195.1 hypothetical protein [Mesorhizobium sp. ESP6-5]